jgi:DNA-directed RNA polymerase subunit RPC12/RpoP
MSSWAKLPEVGETLRETTRAEIREFLAVGLRPVECQSCANRVLVKKSSPQQTSVQWLSDPVTSCPEFAARVAAGELSARIDTCPKLRASIEQASAEGQLEAPDG